MQGIMATKAQVVDTENRLLQTLERRAQDLTSHHARVEQKVNTCADKDVKGILVKLVGLREQLERVSEQVVAEDTLFRNELRVVEGR